MTEKEEFYKRLEESITRKETDLYGVFYKGKRFTAASGKRSWKSIPAAKNAVRNTLGLISYDKDFIPLYEIKRLEDEGVIEYKELTEKYD